jgi:hypothetical protein
MPIEENTRDTQRICNSAKHPQLRRRSIPRLGDTFDDTLHNDLEGGQGGWLDMRSALAK